MKAALIVALTMAIPSAAGAQGAVQEPRTATAVVAADEAWGTAENGGDADFVDRLLLPDYRSVGANGKETMKAAIVAGARARTARPTPKAEVDAWRAAHPLRPEVSIVGDTAILRWVSTAAATAGVVSSCDVFVYVNGAWHAAYSQHAAI